MFFFIKLINKVFSLEIAKFADAIFPPCQKFICFDIQLDNQLRELVIIAQSFKFVGIHLDAFLTWENLCFAFIFDEFCFWMKNHSGRPNPFPSPLFPALPVPSKRIEKGLDLKRIQKG